MRILFIGDSLVKGSVGVNWVRIFASKHKNWIVENAGKNGETLAMIHRRLMKKLGRDRYDVIFFEAGVNDILIPGLLQKGYWFKKAGKYLLKKGANPHQDVADFEKQYRQCINDIERKTSAAIILSTMGCINEDLDAELNRKRCACNKVIREIAREKELGLVDAGALFDGYLRRYKTHNYLLGDFFNTAWFDKIWCRLGCHDHLSKKRGLYLTVDGVHLNKEGAKIYYIETKRQLDAMSSGKNLKLQMS
ncbi:SGNH/GDSL hydrolase family protein [Terrimonas pollutisoli]|uniref:SGNH/GDSL hydrolase family protein n=1 Tax=Terrimonas pollutisoli TaxID=3034147 RepID=UPI0023EAA64D|nr:SGNH/GDSL hydrolase family protein [Terrimonas sp. H1YJ31]